MGSPPSMICTGMVKLRGVAGASFEQVGCRQPTKTISLIRLSQALGMSAQPLDLLTPLPIDRKPKKP